MTRDEHMIWCKNRALEELVFSGPHNACISIMSDLKKHSETENHAGILLTMMLLMGGFLTTHEEVRKHIEGFR